MKKTKLLFIIGGLGVGGKERQLIEIINNLTADKYELQLIIKEKNGYYLELINQEICKIHNVDWKGYRLIGHLQSFKYIKKVIKVVNEIKPDFVVSFSIEMSYLYLISSLFFIYRTKLINFTIRDAPVLFNSFLKFKRNTYNYFKYVVANSNAGLISYKQDNKHNRHVLYNGLNEDRIPDLYIENIKIQLNIPNDKFIVTFVAKQDKRKDHITFFKAIKNIIEYEKSILFLIVGEGDRSNYNKQLVVDNNIHEFVQFIGMSDNPEMYLKSSDINILCSSKWHGEGIPNSVLESFACSTTVIATDNGGTKEIVDDGVNGYLIPNGDYKILAEKIMFLKNNPLILHSMSKNAFLTYKSKFTTDIMISNFERILTECN